MPEELKELIKNAEDLLSKAQVARRKVIDYLETHYDVDVEEYDYFEDECDWCYGLNVFKIESSIEE